MKLRKRVKGRGTNRHLAGNREAEEQIETEKEEEKDEGELEKRMKWEQG